MTLTLERPVAAAAKTGTDIRIEGLAKTYPGADSPVIPNLTAHLRAGEFTVILGPSGCGKSTLLNMLAGLEAAPTGRIVFGTREVQALAPRDRGCAMVFQNYALYPHMTVARNMDYSLRIAKVPRAEREARVAEVARMLELSALLDRRPSQLSGGQRQRVAIGRAIIREPQVLLFDEPLSNLDARLRNETRMELAQLHRRIGATSVFVTHDQVEAMTLADRVMILNKGRIEQFAPPSEIYAAPASTFVAGFLGSPPMNLLAVESRNGRIRLPDGGTIGCRRDGMFQLGIRPEHIRLGAGAEMRVQFREELGSHSVIALTTPDGARLRVTAPPGGTGDALRVSFPQDALHLFDAETGLAVRELLIRT
ncbi:ATP-binding cassette domain-containing protein [Cereibacter sp. SYSU M97828]|nr:ATP-binding cassette domain-containing protein [Cereibacter flavus]